MSARSIPSCFLLLLLTIGLSACKKTHTPGPIIGTEAGPVQGYIEDNIYQYLSIPYAAPPVGDMRWKKPRIPKRWQEPLQTTEIPPHCMQSTFGATRGQEDCLYLNVWTPNLTPGKPLPVMVWIHGGGFTVGHSHETTPGQHLSKRGNVVVVSINYRLGAFGFMGHPDLSKEGSGTSGNYGLLDQIHALKWVQRNIRAFGGDKNNITIFGESAGGMSVCNLLASPYSKGRFNKAIIQSGPCFSPYPDLAFMETQGKTMEEKLQCSQGEETLECMRSKGAEDILAAMPPDPGLVFGEESDYWMPNIDGKVLREQVFESFEQGNFHQVPVINGNNANEGSLLVMFGHEYRFRKLKEEDYPKRLDYLVRDEDKVKAVMAQYPLSNYSDPGDALSEAFGDHTFVCHERFTSDAIAQYAPVYSYYFTYPDADFILPELRDLGAFHSAEVQFIFNDSMAWFEKTFSGEEATLSNNMIDYWSQFAYTGNPNGKVEHQWPEYKTGKRLNMDLALSDKSLSDTDSTCEFWSEIINREFVE